MAFMFFIYVIVYVSGKLKQIFILGLLITIALVFYFLFFELKILKSIFPLLTIFENNLIHS